MNNKNNNKILHSSEYYMYGIHPILAAAKNKARKIKKIYCLQKNLSLIQNALPQHHCIQVVENDFITKHVGKDTVHQGIIALVHTIFKNGLEELKFQNDKDVVVILDQISDPQNIGAIIRSAAAFGIDKMILPKDHAPDENASIAKAACGTLELMQITKVTNIVKTIATLKEKDFWIIGLDAKGNKDLKTIVNINKIAIIIGAEGKGMRRLTHESCDFYAQIPINNQVESLNASNAASIMFYLIRHYLN